MLRFLSVVPPIAMLSVVLFLAGYSSRSLLAESSPDFAVATFNDLSDYCARQRHLPYRPVPPPPGVLSSLSYDQYRQIQFKHQQGVFNDDRHPFWLEFFHRGFVQRDRVDIHVIDPEGRSGPIAYRRDLFEFGDALDPDRIPSDTGFAGLRIAGRFPNRPDPEEMLTFLGSSYFRARSATTVYGSSARGLAIDIGLPRKETFPVFRTFWVFEPQTDSQHVTLLALLDSPQLIGAYQFRFHPGELDSRMSVTAEIYRRPQGPAPEKVALAPITSMWIWGDGLDGPAKDDRPEVHDGDGLLILDPAQDDQRLVQRFRPLSRIAYPSISRFDVSSKAGFGVLQRDRDPMHYRDSNARYEDRPSVWVQPRSSWPGPGHLELMELPGAHEGIDNIGAYYVLQDGLPVNKPLHLQYDVCFGRELPPSMAQVSPQDSSVKTSAAPSPPTPQAICSALEIQYGRLDDKLDAAEEIVIQYHFADHDKQIVSTGERELDVQTVRGRIKSKTLSDDGGITATICIQPTESAPVEVVCQILARDGRPLSERVEFLCPEAEPDFVYPAVYTRQE